MLGCGQNGANVNDRRDFLQKLGIGSAAIGLTGGAVMPVIKRFGAKRDDALRDFLLGSSDFPGINTLTARDSLLLVREEDPVDPVVLLECVTVLEKEWKRRAQGIGDCLSWAFELACTTVTATDILIQGAPWEWKGEFATEPIYGGARVEAYGRTHGGWSDGASGSGGAAWITKWGCLRRHNFSIATGNPEHDLRQYSAEKAKQWGAYGCGGKSDSNSLDEIAAEFPCREALLCTSASDARRAILNGYPIVVCSNQGFTQTRDSNGACKPRGQWAHAMCIIGYYVLNGKRYFILANSWGKSNKGPCPYSDEQAIMDCTFGVEYEVLDRMLKAWNDSWIVTGVNGLERRDFDWTSGWEL